MIESTRRLSWLTLVTSLMIRSLPPPGALGTTISTRLSGRQSAAVVWSQASTARTENPAATAHAIRILVFMMILLGAASVQESGGGKGSRYRLFKAYWVTRHQSHLTSHVPSVTF